MKVNCKLIMRGIRRSPVVSNRASDAPFRTQTGFTLIEMLVGIAIFALIALAVYQTYVALFAFIGLNQNKILAINLANEQFEIVRNLSYADVGIPGGIPNGKIPHVQSITRGGVVFTVTTTIRNIDLDFDGVLGGSPNDLSPADNKLVEVEIECASCKNFPPITLTTSVAPKNLETASTNGALFIKVYDANGVVLPNASVHIENNQISPHIVINDVTDENGMLEIVDVPPGVEAYEITVTKPGYSTDRTYPSGASGNPSPSKPSVTILLQQVTQVSFSIDRLSTLAFNSMTDSCTPVSGIDFSLTGSKLIGQGVPKYSANLSTNGSGFYSNSAIEWDSYTVKGIDSAYDIVGVNPLNPIAVNPGSSADISLIVALKNPKSLLVTVKDGATGLPVTDASVSVTDDASYDMTKTTGRGYVNQTDWSSGSGQTDFIDKAGYAEDDGNIDTSSPAGEIKLKTVFGSFVSDGSLESSTVDTGSASHFYNLAFSPIDEPIESGPESVLFQFATSPSSTPPLGWIFKGPDGTSATYYSPADTSLSEVHTGDRYARYKVFLKTESNTSTPNISDIAFTFTSACTPPGQVIFGGLASGTYHISVSKSGYATAVSDVTVSSSWQEETVTLTP